MGTERGGCSRLMKTPRHNGGAVHSRSMRAKKKDKEKAMMNVSALFGENAAPDKRCGEGIVNILKAAVEEIYTGGLAKVTLNLRGGVKASISQNAKGEINVERTETKKQKLTE